MCLIKTTDMIILSKVDQHACSIQDFHSRVFLDILLFGHL